MATNRKCTTTRRRHVLRLVPTPRQAAENLIDLQAAIDDAVATVDPLDPRQVHHLAELSRDYRRTITALHFYDEAVAHG